MAENLFLSSWKKLKQILFFCIVGCFHFNAIGYWASAPVDYGEVTSSQQMSTPAVDFESEVSAEIYLVGGRKKIPSDWRDAKACRNIYNQVLDTLGGNEARTECYMGLFFMETTCDASEAQAAGNVGNAHAAYGLCSIEASPSVREDNGRGPACENINGVVNQVKCCRAIMKRSPTYFGPYVRGEVGQCG